MNPLQKIRNFFKFASPVTKEIAPGLGTAADYLQRYENPDKAARFEGLKTYRDMRQKESFIKAALQIHRDISYLWVTAAGLSPDEDHAKHAPQLLPASDAPLDMEIWEHVAQCLDFGIQRGFKQVIKQTQQAALTYGYAVEEILWSRDDAGRVVIADILDRDPEMFLYDWPAKQWYNKRSPVDTTGQAIPPRKFLFYAPHLYLENVYGQSELTDLIQVQFAIEQIELFCQRHLEKHGSGLLFGKYPANKEGDKAWQENLLVLLTRLRNQGVSVLPQSVELEILESSGASELFITYLSYLMDKISVSLTGNNMTLKAPAVGSMALSENTAAVSKSQTEQNDATSICHAFDNVIQWLVDYNFGKQARYPYLQLIDPRKMNPVAPKNEETSPVSIETEEESEDLDESPDEEQAPAKAQADNEAEKPGEKAFIRTFADEAEGDKPAAEEVPTPGLIPRKTIPDAKFVEPEIYRDPAVIKYATEYMESQQVLTREAFDRLSQEEKADAFTITAVLHNEELINDLHALLIASLTTANESEAWLSYQKAAVDLFSAKGITFVNLRDLFVSFRYARQRALNIGILRAAESQASNIFGLQYQTQDDFRVRVNHSLMHGVIRPIDDPIWQEWTPPAGFGCRCYLLPVTWDMQRANPEKYQITKELPAAHPDKDFAALPEAGETPEKKEVD